MANVNGYATELAELAAKVAARYPGDDDALRVAEYAQQVVTDHAYIQNQTWGCNVPDLRADNIETGLQDPDWRTN